MAAPLVSIVIPTRNSGRTLRDCIESIRSQTYQKVEVVVVDAHSTDDTLKIVREYGVKPIPAERVGMTAQRNLGAKKALGEHLFHIDADMRLLPTVVEQCVEACRSGARAVVVPQLFDGEGFLGKAKALEIQSYPYGNPSLCVRFFEKALFEQLGGYDESLETGEDWDLAQKMAGRFMIAKTETYVIHGWGRYDIIRRMKQCYRYGRSVRTYARKYPLHAAGQWTPLRLSQMNPAILFTHPLGALGIALLKFCEFEAGALGILSSLIESQKRLASAGN